MGLPLFFKLQKTDFIAVKSSFQTWAPYLQVLERVVNVVHKDDGALVFAFTNSNFASSVIHKEYQSGMRQKKNNLHLKGPKKVANVYSILYLDHF